MSKGEPGRQEDPMVKEDDWSSNAGPKLHFHGWLYSCSNSNLYVKETYYWDCLAEVPSKSEVSLSQV